MPIYEYIAKNDGKGCSKCAAGFDVLQRILDGPLATCPDCSAPIHRLISAPSVGASKTNLNSRAKAAGFHQFKKLGKGEYEKQF